jgi:DNA-binding NarL/FixJ family response regulator
MTARQADDRRVRARAGVTVDEKTFFSQFTTRQHEVLVCVLAGDSNAEIAEWLALSVSSVKRYAAQLRKMAGADDRSSLRARWGLLAWPLDANLADRRSIASPAATA